VISEFRISHLCYGLFGVVSFAVVFSQHKLSDIQKFLGIFYLRIISFCVL
jgi:hypothetical protein